MNRVDQRLHIEPAETFSNRADLFGINCKLKHPSAQFMVGAALYEGFRDMRFVTAHKVLSELATTDRINPKNFF